MTMFCDLESHQLYDEICLFQYVGLKGKAKIIEYPTREFLRDFINKHHTIWYNFSYDGGTIRPNNYNYEIDDLFYAGRSAYPELDRYSLDIFHDLKGMNFYDKTLDKRKMQMSFTTAAAKRARKATPDQIKYAKADVLTLRELWKDKKIQRVIRKNKAYALDIETLKYTLIIQQNGIPVDQSAVRRELEALSAQIKANTETLDGLNPNSPKQVCEALGTNSSDKETMVKLISKGNSLAETIFNQRRLLKAETMLESWDHKRVYTFFNPAGAITGRFTAKGDKIKDSGNINAQQITRKYQYMFHGRMTFEVDYSTAELRAGCSIMGDRTMYKELMAGKDLHIESAKLTGIKNPNRADRQKGKAVSFGLIFSMSANAFQDYAFTNYGVKFTLAEAEAIHRAYHRKYRGISRYQDYCWSNYRTHVFESAMGRRNVCRLGTDASNYSTQSSIAEATKWAVVFMARKYGMKALRRIINIVHDAIYMDVKEDEFKKWEKRLHKAMLLGWKEVSKSDLFHFKDIPMPMETEIIK